MNAVEVRNLSKSFEDVKAVDKISFVVKKGEMFGFLGPNGAGKTTTINMLTGLARPDQGSIRVHGKDYLKNLKTIKQSIGVVPDESNLYPELSGLENLCFCAALYGMKKAERTAKAWELLEQFGLKEAAFRKFGAYSKGMKRKLTIAAGIIHDPEILFLDEPTTGIDVASARQIRMLIARLHETGKTVFLTTHYIEEAERLCERIAFIVSGRIVRIDTMENLLQPMQEEHLAEIICTRGEKQAVDLLGKEFKDLVFNNTGRNAGRSFSRDKEAGEEHVRVKSGEPIPVGRLVRFLEENGIQVIEARLLRSSLEDVFVRITGIEAKELLKVTETKRHGKKKKAGGGT
ncbi:MAG: ABC transporter ATP-binding protein [Deltaproteobacteria bacterium]|nr:ABC transporter ATP-binding protein [Deltaproteobacteria bacterium]